MCIKVLVRMEITFVEQSLKTWMFAGTPNFPRFVGPGGGGYPHFCNLDSFIRRGRPPLISPGCKEVSRAAALNVLDLRRLRPQS